MPPPPGINADQPVVSSGHLSLQYPLHNKALYLAGSSSFRLFVVNLKVLIVKESEGGFKRALEVGPTVVLVICVSFRLRHSPLPNPAAPSFLN